MPLQRWQPGGFDMNVHDFVASEKKRLEDFERWWRDQPESECPPDLMLGEWVEQFEIWNAST